MAESDRSRTVPEARRGLESVVRLYVSRLAAEAGTSDPDATGAPRVETAEERAVRAFDVQTGATDLLEAGEEPSSWGGGGRSVLEGPTRAGTVFRGEGVLRSARRDVPPSSGDELPPLDPADEATAIGEERLPSPRVGGEALHAEAAFRLEGELMRPEHAPVEPNERSPLLSSPMEHPEIELVFEENRGPEATALPAVAGTEDDSANYPMTEGATGWESRHARAGSSEGEAAIDGRAAVEGAADRPMPRIALLIGATPLRLRRMLLEALAEPVAREGRGVLLLESALPLDDATAMLEVALDRGTPVTRRNLGVSARDMLLLSTEERRAIFEDLTYEEHRADLIVIDLELPESILCPRLQFLVDTIVVALTSNESSLYEAYRALRGVQERRPGMEAFVVPFATSAEEAGFLLERFRVIAEQFLKLPVRDGGWLALSADESATKGFDGPHPKLSEEIGAALKSPPAREHERDGFLNDGEESFFAHLRDWFGPTSVN